MKIAKRSDKVAFLEVPNSGGSGSKFYRMTGFKSLSKKMNPKEYSRQYVDEAFETTDIVGMSISQDFEFDQILDSPPHKHIIDIIDGEKLGADAIVNIVQVDFTQKGATDGEYVAVKRAFAIIPESSGDGTDAYTYTGTFKVAGQSVVGKATTTDKWATIDFAGV